ncbi:MAG: hypothetical protein R3A45_09720 [Bdellovibrionota bacterium]
MRTFAFFLSAIVFYATPSWSAQIALQSGEVIDASKIDLPDQISITLEDGSTKKIDTKSIQSIELYQHPSISPLLTPETKLTEDEIKNALDEFRQLKPYETPKQTFLTWKEQAGKGSISGMVDCYASYRQSEVRKKLKKINRKKRKEMQQTMNLTSFTVADAVYQNNQAFLEVTWSKGLHSENQVLTFILEGQEWKIIE